VAETQHSRLLYLYPQSEWIPLSCSSFLCQSHPSHSPCSTRPLSSGPTVTSLMQLGGNNSACELSVSCVDARLTSLEAAGGSSALTSTVVGMRDLAGSSALVSAIRQLSGNSSVLQASDRYQSVVLSALQAANSSVQTAVSGLQSSAALSRALLNLPSSVGQFTAQTVVNSSTSLLPLGTSAPMQILNVKALSVSFWMLTAISASVQMVVELSNDLNSNADSFAISFNSVVCGPGSISVSQISAGYSVFCSISRVDGAWHHITVVMDRTLTTAADQSRIYIDGALTATTQVASYNQVHINAFGIYPLYIGGRHSGSIVQFSGQLSQVQVYTSALYASDVFRLFSSGMSSVASTLQADGNYTLAPLAGWWPLSGSFEDKSGRNATLRTAVPLSTVGVDPTQLQFVPLAVQTLPLTLQYRPTVLRSTAASLAYPSLFQKPAARFTFALSSLGAHVAWPFSVTAVPSSSSVGSITWSVPSQSITLSGAFGHGRGRRTSAQLCPPCKFSLPDYHSILL
jgi:hypothetical protein